MPRRPPINPPVFLNLSLPLEEHAWITQHLWSEVDGRVPHGAYRTWFLERLHEYRTWRTLDLAPYGFPVGMFVKGPSEVLELLKTLIQEQQQCRT